MCREHLTQIVGGDGDRYVPRLPGSVFPSLLLDIEVGHIDVDLPRIVGPPLVWGRAIHNMSIVEDFGHGVEPIVVVVPTPKRANGHIADIDFALFIVSVIRVGQHLAADQIGYVRYHSPIGEVAVHHRDILVRELNGEE